MIKFFLPALGSLIAFATAGKVIYAQSLPESYKLYLKNLFPGISLEVEGGTFVGILTSQTTEGFRKIEISDDSFLTFLGELYKEFYKKEPIYVSITVSYKGEKIPYNPFFQLWDGQNSIKLIVFSKLKPLCKPPVVELNADNRRGIYLFVPFAEVKSKLLTDPPKIPVGYCY